MHREAIQDEFAFIAEATNLDIVGILGRGGFGTVYKAYHRGFEKYVAIKVLNDDGKRDEKIAARFLQEGRLCANILAHENIVAVYSLSQLPDGRLYTIMEYVAGRSLDCIAEQVRRAGWPQVVAIGKQMLHALAYAHKKNILHRDLKPENILVVEGPDPITKLSDFGMAKWLSHDLALTDTGFVVGTPRYLSPERMSGKPDDVCSDIFAAGVVLYELMAGMSPFDSDDLIELSHLHRKPIPPIGTDLPKSLEMVILKAIQPDPRDRYQSAEEFASALAQVEQAPDVVPAEVHLKAPRVGNSLKAAGVASCLIVVLLLLAALCVNFERRKGENESLLRVVQSVTAENPLSLDLESTSDAGVKALLERRLAIATSFDLDEKMFSSKPMYSSTLDEELTAIALTAWRCSLPEMGRHTAFLNAFAPWHFSRYCRSPELKTVALETWKATLSKHPGGDCPATFAVQFTAHYLAFEKDRKEQSGQSVVPRLDPAIVTLMDNSSSDPVCRGLAWLSLGLGLENAEESKQIWATVVDRVLAIHPVGDKAVSNYFYLLKQTSECLHDRGLNDLALVLCKRRYQVACEWSGNDSLESVRSLSYTMVCKNYREEACPAEIRRLLEWIKAHPGQPDSRAAHEHICTLVETGRTISDRVVAGGIFQNAQSLLNFDPHDVDAVHKVFAAKFQKLFDSADYKTLYDILQEESKYLQSTSCPYEQAQNLLARCQLDSKFHRCDAAVKEAEQARELLDGHNLHTDATEALTFIAWAYVSDGNFEMACRSLDRYLDELSRRQVKPAEAWIRTLLTYRFQECLRLWQRKENDLALQNALSAREEFLRWLSTDDAMLAETSGYVAKGYWLLDKKVESGQILKKCLADLRVRNAPPVAIHRVNEFLNLYR